MNIINMQGYDQAQEYYKNLKNKMLDNIINNKEKRKYTKSALQQMKKTLDYEIINHTTKNWSENFQLANDTLNTVKNYAEEIILNNKSAVKKIIDNLDKESKQKFKKRKEQEDYIKKQLIQDKTNIINSLNLNIDVFQNMMRSALPNADISDLTNSAINYFNRYIYSNLTSRANKLAPQFFPRALTLGGYYKEAFEYEGIKELLSKGSNIVTHHAGPKKSEMDIIVSNIESLEDILTRNIQLQHTIDVETDDLILEKKLLKEAEWFGMQVKGYSLSSNALSYRIGSRKVLFNQYLAEKNSAYDSIAAIVFLSRFKNILTALGPTNVLFATGSNRQWTYDFIKTFREKNYLLAFQRSKDSAKMTQEVILDKYITEKNNIRKRYINK